MDYTAKTRDLNVLTFNMKKFFGAFLAVMLLFTLSVQAGNPPADDYDTEEASERTDDDTCEAVTNPCCDDEGGFSVNSLKVVIPMGACTSCGSTGASGYAASDIVGTPILKIYKHKPSPTVFSPEGLRFKSNLNSWIYKVTTDPEKLPDGITREVILARPGGKKLVYQFENDFVDGSTTASPSGKYATSGMTMTAHDTDGDGNPDQYVREDKRGNEVQFDGAGDLERIVTTEGRIIKPGDTEVGMEVIRDGNYHLRQVKIAGSCADVIVDDEFGYSVNIYSSTQLVDEDEDGEYDRDAQGYYILSGEPHTIWTVENPNRDPDNIDQVKVTRTVDSSDFVYNFEYVDAVQDWKLTTGSGVNQRIKEKTEYLTDNENEKLVTSIVKDGNGKVVTKTEEIVKTFTIDGQDKNFVVEKINDPDGAALTEEYETYIDPVDDGFLRRKADHSSDGSWTKYEYDSHKRKTIVVRPYGDVAWTQVESLTASEAAAYGRAVYYDYTAVDPDDQPLDNDSRPRTVTEKIESTVVAKTFHAYKTDANGNTVEITERAASPSASYGDTGNLRTVRTSYARETDQEGNTINPAESGRLKSVRYPDDRFDTYTYEYGTYSGDSSTPSQSSFTAGTGDDLRTTVTHGTYSSPAGIANETTREVSVELSSGAVPLNEKYVYDGTGYERIDWTVKEYDSQGRVTKTSYSDGTTHQVVWGCCGKESETMRDGTEYTYTYDELDRVASKTKIAKDENTADITTAYTYDAAGRVLQETVSDGSQSLTTTREYDLAGRLVKTTDEAGLVTEYSYTDGGRTTTVTQPGGGTRTTTGYFDGRSKSTTGTAVTPSYREYGVNTDGTRWTKSYTGTGDSTAAMWTKTTTDFLGRTVKTEKPAYEGSVAVSENFYNDKGQLIRSTAPGQADTLYVYDELGNVLRSGLDVDSDGQLTLASMDRISETDSVYEKDATTGNWWRKSVSKVYPDDNSDSAVTTSVRRQQITGFSGNVTARSVSEDVHGNETVSVTETDAATKTVTRTVNHPDSDTDSVTVTVNGLTTSQTTKTGLTSHYLYDGLGRHVGSTDPRISQYDSGTDTWSNINVTHYNSKGQVDYTEDTDGNRTSYTYDPDTGRRTVVEDALGKKQYTEYDIRGQVVKQWGDTGYPVSYSYDIFGQMVQLNTYRDGTGWNQSTWPADPGTADTTSWDYQESTGLLLSKTYADSNSVTYTYDTSGKLATRTWARLDNGGNQLVTTYSYDADTGELLTVDYSDNTQDITYIYDRLGRKNTVTDAAGERTFSYEGSTLQLHSETLPSTFYGDKVVTRKYEGAADTLPGRDIGFQLGTSADPDADQNITYSHDTKGRFSSVTDVNGTYTYGYVTDSDMVGTTDYPNGLTATRAYETNRNLVDYVENRVDPDVISKHDYTNDTVGRRTDVVTTGTAFTQDTFNSYGYNDRSEVVAGEKYQGIDINDKTNPVTSYDYDFAYDNIGNRETYSDAGVATTYTANQLNQYEQISTLTDPVHDEDGNMTLMPSSSGDWTLTWNAENRLTTAEMADTKLEFKYDYMGRRIQKDVYTGSTGSWTLASSQRYVYDGWNPVQVLDVQNNNEIVKSFTWGLDLSQSLQGAGGVGGLLAVIEHGETADTPYYATYDANGNISEYLDNTGAVAAHYEYSPFGRLVASTGAKADDFEHRFSTKFFDSETSLYYYGLRYYSPEVGRWVNRDPIGERGGLNVYAFVSNAPLGQIDFIGLEVGVGMTSKEWREFLDDAPPPNPNQSHGSMSNLGGFARWLANIGGGRELHWSQFDPDGTTKGTLNRSWRVKYGQQIHTSVKTQLPCGESTLSAAEYGSGFRFRGFANTEKSWISEYKAKVWKVNGVSVEKNCEDCTYTVQVAIVHYAKDTSDFNEGQSFGPAGRRKRDKNGLIKDDWFLFLQEHTFFGGDYEIWSYNEEVYEYERTWK